MKFRTTHGSSRVIPFQTGKRTSTKLSIGNELGMAEDKQRKEQKKPMWLQWNE